MPPDSDVRRAAATLARGTRFFGAGLRAAGEARDRPCPIAGPLRAKVLGNGLRELDRFLNLLVDAVSLATCSDRTDHARFVRLRNTPNKLRLLHARLGLASPDHEQLRAIGRLRDCLFHCGGTVGRPRRGDEPVISWPITGSGPAAAMLAPDERLELSADDLAAICRFYERLGADLVGVGSRYGGVELAFP